MADLYVATAPLAAVYLRCSRDSQTNRSQRAAVMKYLRDNKLRPLFYRDKGESSEATSRPQWDRLMLSLRAGKIKTLIVFSLDRIGRWSLKDDLRFRLEMSDLGVKIVSISEPDVGEFDSLIGVITSVVKAQARRDWIRLHGERSKAAYQRAKARAKPGERIKWGKEPRVPEWELREVHRRCRLIPHCTVRSEAARLTASMQYGEVKYTTLSELLRRRGLFIRWRDCGKFADERPPPADATVALHRIVEEVPLSIQVAALSDAIDQEFAQ